MDGLGIFLHAGLVAMVVAPLNLGHPCHGHPSSQWTDLAFSPIQDCHLGRVAMAVPQSIHGRLQHCAFAFSQPSPIVMGTGLHLHVQSVSHLTDEVRCAAIVAPTVRFTFGALMGRWKPMLFTK